MIREEAIIHIGTLRTVTKDIPKYSGKAIDEALDMAIKALEQEPCENAIDRAEAMTEIMMFAGNVKSDEEDIYIKVSDAVQLLRELPPVTPQPKTGHWEMCEDSDGIYGVCSECDQDADFSHYGKAYCYCPNCGAKMENQS